MSYDLVVFDPTVAPIEHDEFLSWYNEQTEWEEPHNYDDPQVSSVALRAWFLDIIVKFPAMNGPYTNNDLPNDDVTVTDYSIGSTLIYATFSWSKMQEAYKATFRFATKHRLGFFDMSSDTGGVWLPDSSGNLIFAQSN